MRMRDSLLGAEVRETPDPMQPSGIAQQYD